ncbi:hypothetical protein F4821DRAFT_191172 [Hypoxylon rubiginosum]|uniref:Uncharacterized protein n=1 Tax=Hypoxylon rubiginosum TaxID=110542 RepID=A0ACC0CSZ4_9PEZI|nr:hypothetical protein F4821DRAFT_191172 [Hypoxylon rubiginosum]
MADNSTGTDAQTPQNESPTNTAAYNEGVDSASRTLDVIKGIDTFLGSPISTIIASRVYKRRLQRELGEWHDFLYDGERDICLSPVLTTFNFSRYLKSCKGAFHPQGQCKATARWAQFLHGLGITPDKNIVSRRLVQVKERGSIMLEIDGEVVCHVVNLLGSPERDLLSSIAKSRGHHRTSIGNIRWDSTEGAISLSYIPGSEYELSRPRIFFDAKPGEDPDDIIARYYLALELGTSYTELVWPPPTTPLPERIKKLSENHALLQYSLSKELRSDEWSEDSSDKNPHDSCKGISAKNKPVFFAAKWLEHSERIYRRALGGERVLDFFKDVCANLDPRCWDKHELWCALSSPPHHLLCYYDDISPKQSHLLTSGEVSSLDCTLLAYGNEPEGSWKHTLSLCREQIPNMVRQEYNYVVMRGCAIIIPLDSTTALWQAKGLWLE